MKILSFNGTYYETTNSKKSFAVKIYIENNLMHFAKQTGEITSSALQSIDFKLGGFENRELEVSGLTEDNKSFICYIDSENKIDFLNYCLPYFCGSSKDKIRKLIHQSLKTRRYVKFVLISASAVFLTIIIFILIFINFMSGYILNKIPQKYDGIIGEIAANNTISKYKRISNGKLYDEVNRIFNIIASNSQSNQYKFKLYMCDNPLVNALSTPGGHVIVFTGLLKNVESAEELAGILAHECAHITCRHSIKQLLKQSFWFAIKCLLSSDSAISNNTLKISNLLANQAYSREDEQEADEMAVKILLRANIDPTKFLNFFERNANLKHPNYLEDKLQILSTHPTHNNRLKYLNKMFSDLPNKDYPALSLNWKEFIKEIE